MPKGSALVTNAVPISSNITIENGGVEIVENGRTSVDATIKKGGMQVVTHGSTAMNTKVQGGKQFIFEDKSIINLEGLEKRSSAYTATVTGVGGAVGQQNIYDGGKAWYTKVMEGGEQNIYMGQREDGGIAEGTIASGNGRQNVLKEGMAIKTTLKDGAVQVVYPGGILDGLTINGSASSWIHVGAELIGEIQVNDGGHLYLYAGDSIDSITKEKLSVKGRTDEVLFLVGERNNKEKPQVAIEDLGGNGGHVIFASIPYEPRHISLQVQLLSGSLTFHFNMSSTGGYGSDYLWIDSGSGDHKIHVTDSGSEITDPFSQKKNIMTQLNLVTDRSPGEGANFTLADGFGTKTPAVDGGAYMYSLHKRKRCAESSGDATVWYLAARAESSDRSNSHGQCVKNKSKTRVPFVASSSDMGAQSNRNSSSSQNRNSNSQVTTSNKNSGQKPKQRPPRHLREAQHPPVPPTIPSLENPADGISLSTGHHHYSDEKEQTVVSVDGQSLADQMTMRPSQQDQSSSQSREEMPVPRFLTTPSTDSVLSISVAPALIFHHELQTVRTGRGIVDRSKKHGAFWVHAIKSKDNVAADHRD
ncbi:pertactin-like passenger domain-containing protein, partial [Bartonella senegalensis]|uniref:pertactin-like passenger domain-containing protein n=1 Tax=Bartonella senegalensis TaxID=1468418 RepID=UPI000683FE13